MIHLTCGHRVNSFQESHHVFIQSWDREHQRTVSSEVICDNCFEIYKGIGIIFETEESALKWLTC